MTAERLQKILAQAGVASRRAAEQYIVEGRVRVNGKVVRELGSKADPNTDTIAVDGWGTLAAQPLVYIALHKPPGVVTTVKDPEERDTVIDLVSRSRAVGKRRFEGELPRVYPVGRLDFDGEGLVLLTNDGELAHALLHPRFHVPKTYVVKVHGRPDERALERLRRGIHLIEEPDEARPAPRPAPGRSPGRRFGSRPRSRRTAPADVRMVRESPSNTWLEITIMEGRHHQVKRMCMAIRHRVIRLIRTDFGGIPLEPLPTGAWRFLTEQEVTRLQRWVKAAPRRR